jgi:hypothetical protein
MHRPQLGAHRQFNESLLAHTNLKLFLDPNELIGLHYYLVVAIVYDVMKITENFFALVAVKYALYGHHLAFIFFFIDFDLSDMSVLEHLHCILFKIFFEFFKFLLDKSTFNLFKVELDDVSEKTFDLPLDEPLENGLVARFLFVGLFGVNAHVLDLAVAFENRRDHQLHDCHATLKGHEGNFGTDAHDQVLQVDFAEQNVFVGLLDVVHDRVADQSFSGRPFVVFDGLLVHELKHFVGGVPVSVQRPQIVDEVLQKAIHLLLVLDHQVHVAVAQLQRKALPAVKRQVLEFLGLHQVEVLPKHPKPTRSPSENDALNGIDIAAAATFANSKFLFITFFLVLICFLRFFKHFRIRLEGILNVLQRFFVENIYLF